MISLCNPLVIILLIVAAVTLSQRVNPIVLLVGAVLLIIFMSGLGSPGMY